VFGMMDWERQEDYDDDDDGSCLGFRI